MVRHVVFLLLLLTLWGNSLTLKLPTRKPKMINCYFSVTAFTRLYNKMEPEQIPDNLCTHLSYAFFDISRDGALTLDTLNDVHVGKKWIERVIAVRNRNPKLKVIAAVGGEYFKERPQIYMNMLASKEKRDLFIDSTIRFLEHYEFDGLDLCWIGSGEEGDVEAKKNLVIFVRELSKELSSRNFLFGISVSPIERNYDVRAISRAVDYINVLTFNFGDPHRTSFAAPLYGQGIMNVNASMSFWMDNCAPSLKLNIGVSFHSWDLVLEDERYNKPGSQAMKLLGERSYYNYCQELVRVKPIFDKTTGGTYFTEGRKWTSYESAQSLEAKYDYLLSQFMGGVAIYSLDADDFHPRCGEAFHLTEYTQRKLGGEYISSGGISCHLNDENRETCHKEY
uniref:GH18 domain-containing protein n=1 Tax=Stomoxys calcitrans TaxID=35570 RepID=A0A1I8Q2J9_STOCA